MTQEEIKEIANEVVNNTIFCTKEVLTSDEAAAYMGISKSYLYKLTMKQLIPHYKPMGKMCYFNRKELESWLQSNRVAVVEESDINADNYGLFTTEKQAKSALAMARISQIMANDIENFGGTITDEEWGKDEWKFVICRSWNRIFTKAVRSDYYFLAFHTEAQRHLFLEKYHDLVSEFLMIG